MFSVLRDSGLKPNRILSEMGHYFEQFVLNQFKKRGIEVKCGKHLDDKGETDLIVETDSTIFLFEVKKTYRSQHTSWGHSVYMLEDLTKGLAYSQCQLLRTEQKLRSQKQLKIKKPLPFTLSLNNRRIVRITVTLDDFGALHDPVNARNFLMAMADAQFSVVQESWNKRIDGINSAARKLANQLIETVKHVVVPSTVSPDKIEEIRWDIVKHETKFVSVQQLMNILDHCSSAQDFETEIMRNDRVTLGIHDPLWEWWFSKTRK
jgi:hypothetical protein